MCSSPQTPAFLLFLPFKPVVYTGKDHPITGLGPRGGVEGYFYSFLTSALVGGGWSAPHPGRFTKGKDPVPIIQETGWTPGPVWTCAKNLSPTGIRSPDRPARSQSLYRLSYPAHVYADDQILSLIRLTDVYSTVQYVVVCILCGGLVRIVPTRYITYTQPHTP
jgi:hypothetical protein